MPQQNQQHSFIFGAWEAACLAQTGATNEFLVNEQLYFWERDKRRHSDGASTGTIHRVVVKIPTHYGHNLSSESVGTFRVEADGRVTRAPAFLARASGRNDHEIVSSLVDT